MRIENFRSKFINYPVTVKRSVYNAGERIALILFDDDGAPAATVTVNLPDVPLAPDEVILKGWSENEGIPDALERHGIVGPQLRSVQTGFVSAGIHKMLLDVEDLHPNRMAKATG